MNFANSVQAVGGIALGDGNPRSAATRTGVWWLSVPDLDFSHQAKSNLMKLQRFSCSVGTLLCLVGFSTPSHALSVVPNFNIGGIPPPGYAHFDMTSDVQVSLVKSGSGAAATYQLQASYVPAQGSALFQQNPWLSFGMVGSYQLTASFNSGATLTGGSVTINGTVPGYGYAGYTPPPSTPSLLYRADLAAYGADTVADATPMALGFRTTNPSGWAAQFQTTDESVYLYGFNVAALMSSFTSNKFKSTSFNKASALTTVPIPAASWLFGSALIALSRRRRSGAAH